MTDKRIIQPLQGEPRERNMISMDAETFDYDDDKHAYLEKEEYDDGDTVFVYGSVYDGETLRKYESKESIKMDLTARGDMKRRNLRDSWIICHNADFDLSVTGILPYLRDLQEMSPIEQNSIQRSANIVTNNGFVYAQLSLFGIDEELEEEVMKNYEKGNEAYLEENDYNTWNQALRDVRTDVRHIKYVDTVQFFKSSLDEATDMMELDDGKDDFDIDKMDTRAKMKSTGDWEEMKKYNHKDTKILYKAMKKFESLVNEIGATLQETLASTSLDLFRRQYQEEVYTHPDDEAHELCEEGRYGGYTMAYTSMEHGAFNSQKDNLIKSDVNSFYPSEMQDGVPAGNNMIYYDRDLSSIEKIKEHYGMSRVRIEVPEDETHPVLPKKINGRLQFPVGEMTGVWTHHELEYAMERGYEIKSVMDQALAFDEIEELSEFVNDIYSRRIECKIQMKTALEVVLKLILNAQYGKWCQGDIEIWQSKSVFDNTDNKVKTEHIVTEDGHTLPVEKELVDEIKVNNNHPVTGAYITAKARVELIDSINKIHENGGKVIYCDTDSMVTIDVTESELRNILDIDDTRLGAWDIERMKGQTVEIDNEEKTIDNYSIIVQREKSYHEILEFEDGTKEEFTTYKGVPDEFKKKAFYEGYVEWMDRASHSESLRRDINPQQMIKRTRDFETTSSHKRQMTDDYSVPHHIDEFDYDDDEYEYEHNQNTGSIDIELK